MDTRQSNTLHSAIDLFFNELLHGEQAGECASAAPLGQGETDGSLPEKPGRYPHMKTGGAIAARAFLENALAPSH